jgi:hypothetical protein
MAELMRPSTIEQAGRVLPVEDKRARLNSFDHIAHSGDMQGALAALKLMMNSTLAAFPTTQLQGSLDRQSATRQWRD